MEKHKIKAFDDTMSFDSEPEHLAELEKELLQCEAERQTAAAAALVPQAKRSSGKIRLGSAVATIRCR